MIKDYFRNINTEEKAYWLGFLYADGCITDKRIIVDLHIKDIEHIKKFQKYVDSSHKLWIHGDNDQYVRLVVGCKEMCIDLCQNGCVPRKSLILSFPDKTIVPTDLMSHFIRGYFDGDGCLSFSQGLRKRNDRNPDKLYPYGLWFLKIVGTKSMMTGISKYLEMTNKLYQYDININNFSLKCGGNKKVKEIMSKFYDNANIYLDRKYEKYKILHSFKS